MTYRLTKTNSGVVFSHLVGLNTAGANEFPPGPEGAPEPKKRGRPRKLLLTQLNTLGTSKPIRLLEMDSGLESLQISTKWNGLDPEKDAQVGAPVPKSAPTFFSALHPDRPYSQTRSKGARGR